MSDWASATELAAQVRRGELRAADVAAAALARVANDPLHAFLRACPQRAHARAETVDAQVAAGEDPGPLAGVPIAIKDNLCTAGVETTAGSKLLAGFVPPYDAEVVRRVEAAGAIVVGKTNLDEFSMGSSTEHSAFGPTLNPWDPSRVPGGSSGGSAAAVAGGLVPLALGSDTGGSIRQPAALCGCVGLKPTYGAVSRRGLIAFGSSLDQVGPFARSVGDLAALLDALCGHDPADMTSEQPAWTGSFAEAAQGASLAGATLGVVRDYLELTLDPEVRASVEAAVSAAEAQGATVREVSLDHTALAIPAYQVLATAEASTNLARFDGVAYGVRAGAEGDAPVDAATLAPSTRRGFGPEVRRRILLGTFALSSGHYDAYYLKAQQARRVIRADFLAALDGVDALIGPTSPVPAFPLGEKLADPLAMYALDVFTVSTNLAGLPALSLPCGFTDAGLPIGVQLTGAPWSDLRLVALAAAWEQALGLDRRPGAQ